jgi:hypothetical protein
MDKSLFFGTFWTFSHRDKSRNDTELVSAGCQDLKVSVVSVGRVSKNRFLKEIRN